MDTLSQKSLATVLQALLSGTSKTVSLYDGEEEDDYSATEGVKERIDRLKEKQNQILTEQHRHGLSNIQCKILGPLFTHVRADTTRGIGAPMERTKSVEEAGLSKGHLSFKGLRGLSSRCFRISRDLLAAPGFGKDIGATSYLGHILREINEVCQAEVVAAIHCDGDGHCLVHAVSRCLVGQEFFWHALRTDLWWRLQADRDRYVEVLALQELYKDEDFKEWKRIVSEADPKYIPPRGVMLGLEPVHLFGLANILRRPILLLDGEEGGECGLFLPVLSSPEDGDPEKVSTKKLLCVAWANRARDHFCAVVPIEGQRCLIPKRLLPQNSGVLSVWGVSPELVDLYVDTFIAPNGEACFEIGPGTEGPVATFDAAVSIMQEEFKKIYKFHTNFVCEVFKSQDAAMCNQLNQLPVEQLLAQIDAYHVFYCPICTIPILARSPTSAVCMHCGTRGGDLRKFDKKTGEFVLEDHDRVRTATKTGYGCCGFRHFFQNKEYDVAPLPMEIAGKVVNLKFFNSDPDLNTSEAEIDEICHEAAIRYEGLGYSYDAISRKVRAGIEKQKESMRIQLEKKIKERGQEMQLEPIPKEVVPVAHPEPTPSAPAPFVPLPKPKTKAAAAEKTKSSLDDAAMSHPPPPSKPASRQGQVQFAFPNGGKECGEFSSEDRIAKLFEFVSDKIGLAVDKFTLTGGWPPKPLSSADTQTLGGAQLLGSSVRVTFKEGFASGPALSSTALPSSSPAASGGPIEPGKTRLVGGVLVRAPARDKDEDSDPDSPLPRTERLVSGAAGQQRGIFGFDSLRSTCGSAGTAEKKLKYPSLPPYDPSQLKKGGFLYNTAKEQHGLGGDKLYSFKHIEGLQFRYDPILDSLVSFDPFTERMKRLEQVRREEELMAPVFASLQKQLEKLYGPLVHGRVYRYMGFHLRWDSVGGKLQMIHDDGGMDEGPSPTKTAFSGQGLSVAGGAASREEDDYEDDYEDEQSDNDLYDDINIAARTPWRSEQQNPTQETDSAFFDVVTSLSRSASADEGTQETTK